MQNERIWLQSYVTKLEGRVNELERSNKILQQKCESMAHHQNEQYIRQNSWHTIRTNIRQNSTKDPSPSNTPTNYIEKTLEKMHEKVSHFLVQQMDKQLDISSNLRIIIHRNLRTELLQHMNHQALIKKVVNTALHHII